MKYPLTTPDAGEQRKVTPPLEPMRAQVIFVHVSEMK